MGTLGSDYSMDMEGGVDMRGLAEESVGLRKLGLGFVERRMMEGTGCFLRKGMDLDFL